MWRGLPCLNGPLRLVPARQAPVRPRRPALLLREGAGVGPATSCSSPRPGSRSATAGRSGADGLTRVLSTGSGRSGQWSRSDSTGRTAVIVRAPHRSQRHTLTRNPRVHRCARLAAVPLIALRLPRHRDRSRLRRCCATLLSVPPTRPIPVRSPSAGATPACSKWSPYLQGGCMEDGVVVIHSMHNSDGIPRTMPYRPAPRPFAASYGVLSGFGSRPCVDGHKRHGRR